MKNLSKENLIERLKEELGILREINRLEKSGTTKLKEWKYLTMGGIHMLQSLIEEQE